MEKDKQLSTKTLKKLKIEQHEPHKKLEVNSGPPEVVSAPLVEPVLLLLSYTNIMW